MKKYAVLLALSAAIFYFTGCSRGNLTGPSEIKPTVAAVWPTSTAEVDSLYDSGRDLAAPIDSGRYGNYDLKFDADSRWIVVSHSGKIIYSDTAADGSHYFQCLVDTASDLIIIQLGYYGGSGMGRPVSASLFADGKKITGLSPLWVRINPEFPSLLLVKETDSGSELAKGAAGKKVYSVVDKMTCEVRSYN